MSSLDPIEEHRHTLGLTHEEAYLYEILLTIGPSDANNLAVGMDILPQAVYRHANNLVRKKFAVIRPGWPRQFEAVPVEAALQVVKRQAVQAESAARRGLLQQKTGMPAIPAATDMEILSGRQALYDKYIELAQAATTEILAYTIGIAFNEKLHKTQTEVLAMGVEMRHIVQRYSRENFHIIQKWQRIGAKVRYLPAPLGFHLMVFDGKSAIIALSNPADTEQRVSFVINNAAAVQAMRDYFYGLWAQARLIN